MKIITQKELVESIANQLLMKESEVKYVVDELKDSITQSLKKGDVVKLTSFGTFQSRLRHARGGVNPQKPEERINIPAVRVAKFKTGKGLKMALKNK